MQAAARIVGGLHTRSFDWTSLENMALIRLLSTIREGNSFNFPFVKHAETQLHVVKVPVCCHLVPGYHGELVDPSISADGIEECPMKQRDVLLCRCNAIPERCLPEPVHDPCNIYVIGGNGCYTL